jgi:hypothetical protein
VARLLRIPGRQARRPAGTPSLPDATKCNHRVQSSQPNSAAAAVMTPAATPRWQHWRPTLSPLRAHGALPELFSKPTRFPHARCLVPMSRGASSRQGARVSMNRRSDPVRREVRTSSRNDRTSYRPGESSRSEGATGGESTRILSASWPSKGNSGIRDSGPGSSIASRNRAERSDTHFNRNRSIGRESCRDHARLAVPDQAPTRGPCWHGEPPVETLTD